MDRTIKVGYIDDDLSLYESYRRKLKHDGIALISFAMSEDKANYIDQILSNQVMALLIDYKMVATVGYYGTSLINYINDEIHDMTCFILTAVESDKITDKLVPDDRIYTKDVFDTEADDPERVERYQTFVRHLKNCAEVFASRQKLKCEEYETLYQKSKKGRLTLAEEDDFHRLYRVLSSYGMVEALPEQLLSPGLEERLDQLISQGKEILGKMDKKG